MKSKLAFWIALSLFLNAGTVRSQDFSTHLLPQLEKAGEPQLKKLLERFPSADANRDGILTREEAIAYTRARMKTESPWRTEEPAPDSHLSNVPVPTEGDVAYGPHERNVLDFWMAAGEGPRPLVVFIHGGGFTGGDKSKWHREKDLARLLDNGISCAAINYRFRKDAPIQDILYDAARAVQLLRTRAEEWNLDPGRFAGWGGSAGAGTSLWLATRDDLADAEAEDPVLRESSKLQAAVLQSTQATYDLTRWEAFLGPSDPTWWHTPHESAEFYHFKVMDDLKTPAAMEILRECDMLRWISPDDGPVFVSNRHPDEPSKNRGHYLHHPGHAREIQRYCDEAGVQCLWVESGETAEADKDPVSFVMGVFGLEVSGAGQ